MKKIFALFMMLVLALGVLAACAPERPTNEESEGNNNEEGSSNEGNEGETSSDKPEKLVIWEDKEKGPGLEPAIKSFEEEYGIKVEYKEMDMATDIRKNLRLDGPAGSGPDVLTLPHDQIGQVATEGLISPLEVSDEVKNRYTESSILAETYNGKLYGLPKATETPVFIYNKDLMEEPPENFEDLYKFSQDFGGEKEYGFLALWDNYYFAHAVIGGFGGYVFENQDGTLNPEKLGLNNEGAIKGAEYIEKWYDNVFPSGIVGESGGSTKGALFEEGKVASQQDGPWAFQGLSDKGINYGVAPMPKLPNGEYPTTFMGVKGWHVSSYSENKEWATKLVEWIANKENAKIRFEKTAEIPPVKSLIEDPIIADDPKAKAVAVQSSRATPMPNIPEMAEVWGPMAQALQLVATDKAQPEEALNNAVETIKANIEANHSE